MKRDETGSVKSVRAAAVAPAQVVLRNDQVNFLAALRLRAHLLKLHRVVPVQALPLTMEVVAMLGAERCQIRVPGPSGQRDEWAGIGGCLSDAPTALTQRRSDSGSRTAGPLELRPVEHEPLSGQARRQGPPHFRFTASPNDYVQIIRAHQAGSQEFQHGKRTPADQAGRTQRAGRQRDQFSLATDRQDRKSSVAGQVFPPGMKPLPGQKETVRIARLQKAIPLLL